MYFTKGPITRFLIADWTMILNNVNKHGAMMTFSGIVRPDTVNGDMVRAMEYTNYEPLSSAVMAKIERNAKEKFDVEQVFFRHSLGRLKVGDISLWVAILSRHRKPLFEAMESVVDQIKFDVPIWKKELFESGFARWKEDKRGD